MGQRLAVAGGRRLDGHGPLGQHLDDAPSAVALATQQAPEQPGPRSTAARLGGGVGAPALRQPRWSASSTHSSQTDIAPPAWR